MKTSIPGIVFGILIFFVFQMVLPFPYGIILGILFAGIIIWYTKKHVSKGKDSLLNYRRTDPINEKEKELVKLLLAYNNSIFVSFKF